MKLLPDKYVSYGDTAFASENGALCGFETLVAPPEAGVIL
jgi:hypothetical protein